jgi:hypothetical protein
VVIQGVATKSESTRSRHCLYVLEADSLRKQVHDEGGVGVGASVIGAIIIVVLGDRDPLGSGELLFWVMDGGLLLSSEANGELAHPGLIQGLACDIHGGDDSLLLSVRGSGGGLSHDRDVVLLPLSDGGGDLLLIDEEVGGVAQHGRQDDGG